MDAGDGLALLEEASASRVATPILMITGVGTVEDAVAAMKAGAHDFLQKPVDPDELVLLVRRAARHRALAAEAEALRLEVARLRPDRALTGSSAAIEAVRAAIARLAPGELPVLVRGESGSGKGLVAGLLHAASARAEAPLVAIDCAALEPANFEPALLGVRRGPPGALREAQGGTLLLDRVDELAPAAQPMLARLLESPAWRYAGETRQRTADVRWIATSRADLRQLAAQGAFLAELAALAAAAEIGVPPLRERIEDLPELVAHFSAAARARLRLGRAGPAQLAGDALEILSAYGWPGNVRELANVVERATLLAQGGEIDAATLQAALEVRRAPRPVPAGSELNLRSNLDRLERELVLRAIARTRGRKRDACELLGIDARNLGYYLRKHRIGEAELGRVAD
jgi:DNA-binding NtrC family response regulator